MRMGHFFSLGDGKVGQFLSPRVLVVRSPFQAHRLPRRTTEFSCFGFDTFSQAQRFIQSLSHLGLRFELRPGKVLPHSAYEVILWGNTDLARTLAFWDRHDLRQFQLPSETLQVRSKSAPSSPDSTPAIAA
ncbi:hypothetical protein H6G89_27210 [Oscillatoria sp. FACHB-1407]|uniref:hypothetical protein n=1 Tax=Oscillatoria sp. FACHB-1407 TaxID=2692847 RepID=UPI001689C675|nr:hypothetical protein [Oscillatoria sp. FACHB-1407]MBD2464698.1 hypothetical protein [Oscillatoria sp. FACHB-1407]